MTDKNLRISEAQITRALAGGEQVSASPKNVWIVPYRPKTRSGNIMRRVPASISNGKGAKSLMARRCWWIRIIRRRSRQVVGRMR